MNAIVIEEFGDADKLHEMQLPQPEILADEVLVRMVATSVNPIDWKAREGAMQSMYPWDFPVVLGWDVSGIVEKVGENVQNFRIGDEIFARPDIYMDGKKGTYAEYVAVKEDKLAVKPKNITFEEAAAVPLAGLTAWQVLVDRLNIQKGDKVLIQGGAGGVGLFAVQIAKYLGAYVATTASSKNKGMLFGLGADEVVDYHNQTIQEELSSFDAVFDTVDKIEEGLSILKPGGKLVTIAGHPNKEQRENDPIAEEWFLQSNGVQLKHLAELLENGNLKVILDSEYLLTEKGVRAAHVRSESHHAVGKIVIKNKH